MLSPGRTRPFSRFHSSGRWFFGSHCPLRVAQREDPLLRARPLLVAPRAAERRVVAAGLERVEQRLGLEQAAAARRAQDERLRAFGDRFLVGVHDQPHAHLFGVPVAEVDHLLELVGRVDVEQREGNRPRVERLLREPQQHRGVLADRVEHHRPLELGDHFPEDVHAFRLEHAQVIEAGLNRRRSSEGWHVGDSTYENKKARAFVPGLRSSVLNVSDDAVTTC